MFNHNDKVTAKLGGLYTVDKVEGDHAICFPRGGGFGKRIPLDHLTKVDKFPVIMKKGFALGEWDETATYPCVCDPTNRWNGWAQPLFTEQVFIKILNDMKLKHSVNEENITYDDGSGFDDVVAEPNKDGLYFFDGWCWDFEEK